MGHWNDFYSALIYINSQQLLPLQSILRKLLLSTQMTLQITSSMSPDEIMRKTQLAQTLKYSSIIVSTVPVLCLYPLVQKHFVKGIMIGSVKDERTPAAPPGRGTGEGGKEKMKNEHWIQGDNLCEAPLFRRSFFLEEIPGEAKIEICGLGYFLLYVNGERVGDQEFIPAVTNYSSVLGCDTTYPVWGGTYRVSLSVCDV